MRDPVGAIIPGTTVTIYSGNQFQGDGNAANQVEAGSSLLYRLATDANWTAVPLTLVPLTAQSQQSSPNNHYYRATIPKPLTQLGNHVQYYLSLHYTDRDQTFVHGTDTQSFTTPDESLAKANPFNFAVESSAVRGKWDPTITLPNVAIHAHVLPNKKVLFWGRRLQKDVGKVDPEGNLDGMDVQDCEPFIWDPATGAMTDVPHPPHNANLFCSGHTFLPNGNLMVVGGHLQDTHGSSQASEYNPETNVWTAHDDMNNGRWYPAAITLEDGRVLVASGSNRDGSAVNRATELWDGARWVELRNDFPNPDPQKDVTPELYPRLHLLSTGKVFMSGALFQTYLLDTATGQWQQLAERGTHQADYAPSVLYDRDQVIYVGGGGGQGTPPISTAFTIDFRNATPKWSDAGSMNFARRHHNATVLADGTVLVTGGTRRADPDPVTDDNGFNDLQVSKPVHIAELWDPAKNTFTELAAEEVDRCYHATAVLLPDGSVLSAGGGEFHPKGLTPPANQPEDSHLDAQVFNPPYLCTGTARPVITAAPAAVDYGEVFEVSSPQATEIASVSFIRLSSVTHAFNATQRFMSLGKDLSGDTLKVTAPDSPRVCPPGHYLLFILNGQGVPSEGAIVQVRPIPAPTRATPILQIGAAAPRVLDAFARREAVLQAARGTSVTVGIVGTCPYGIAACWGGAHEALNRLHGVELVNPIPDAGDSTAQVFLTDDGLPAVARWNEQFQAIVAGRYVFRGVEVRLTGTVEHRNSSLRLSGTRHRPPLSLVPLGSESKVQWDRSARAPRAVTPAESGAYDRVATLEDGRTVTVAGPLIQRGTAYELQVRQVDA